MSSPPRILITAGPTHEPIDAVRYLANRSSGRMGMALAAAATDRGWLATLLLGPTALEPPHHSHLKVIRFQTTADLQRLLREHWPLNDVLFMAAAVADFRPISASIADGKITRADRTLTLQLEPTPDLLADLSGITRPNQMTVGFALEPADRLLDSARQKLIRKNLHAIVANPLQTMDSPTIDGTLLFASGTKAKPHGPRQKAEFAAWLLDQIAPDVAALRSKLT